MIAAQEARHLRDHHVVLGEAAARGVEHRRAVGDALGDDPVARLGDDDVRRRRRDPRSAARVVDVARRPACDARRLRAGHVAPVVTTSPASRQSRLPSSRPARRSRRTRRARAARRPAGRGAAARLGAACRRVPRDERARRRSSRTVSKPPCIGSRQPPAALRVGAAGSRGMSSGADASSLRVRCVDPVPGEVRDDHRRDRRRAAAAAQRERRGVADDEADVVRRGAARASLGDARVERRVERRAASRSSSRRRAAGCRSARRRCRTGRR